MTGRARELQRTPAVRRRPPTAGRACSRHLPREEIRMTSIALLILRVTVGGLLAGHGAQKLFGSFGGHGVEGTAGWLESMNLKPGRQWALMAGLSEFGGGVLTALGALN